jgi:hypothetical protein
MPERPLERNQKKIDAIQQGLEVKDRLAQVISQVCSDTKGKLERKLKKSEPLALQTLVQQIFEEFTIGKRGYGRGCESWVEEGYILREGLQDLLGLRGTSVEVMEHRIVYAAGGQPSIKNLRLIPWDHGINLRSAGWHWGQK